MNPTKVEIVVELVVTQEMKDRILRRRQPVKPIGEPIVSTEIGEIDLGTIE